jgi:hypothetical protein
MDKTNTSSSNLILVFIQALNDYTLTILTTRTPIRNEKTIEAEVTLRLTVSQSVCQKRKCLLYWTRRSPTQEIPKA